MNLSTYAKITYAMGEMYLRSEGNIDLSDLTRFKFSETINPEIARKVLELVNFDSDKQNLAAVLPGAKIESSKPTISKDFIKRPTPQLDSDQKDHLPDDDQEPTRPR